MSMKTTFWAWTIGLSILLEAVTVLLRKTANISADEFNAKYKIPILLQIHHMFWGVLLIGIAFFARNKLVLKRWLLIIGMALVFSDLAHHLLVSPILYGTMSWHWP